MFYYFLEYVTETAGQGAGGQPTLDHFMLGRKDNKMNLSRLFLSLALMALALLALKFAVDPLADKNIAATTGEAIGGVVGGLIWGLFIWVPIRLIRGADKAPDIRRVTLYAAAIFVAIFIVFPFIVGVPMSEIERLVLSPGS